MTVSQKEFNETRDKILKGCHLAMKRLIKERQKSNGTLVIMIDGKIKHVPAKDI